MTCFGGLKWTRGLVGLLTGLALVSCSSSDGNGTTAPEAAPITIAPLTGQLSQIATGDAITQDSQKSIEQLANDIGKVMASKGGLSGDQVSVPGIFADGAEAEDAWPVTGMLWTPVHAGRAERAISVFDTPVPDDIFGAPPGPPLGITCIWNLESAGWGGSPNIFGDPPADGIRFENYEVANGQPVEPLVALQTVVDVRPRQQSSVTGEAVNVVIDVALKNTTSEVMSYVLAGNSNADAGILDMMMAGDYTSAGGSPLDFVLAIDGVRASTSMRVQDLIINTSIEASGGTARGYLAVRKLGSPRQLVEYDFNLSGATTISSGSVIVDNEVVATMGGARLLPTWTVTNQRFTETDNLNILYDALLFMDSTINAQFFFSHCIGADHPQPCAQMLTALGL